MDEITNLVKAFCREHGISIYLSYDMPEGYETAYGTYDVTINTLFLNSGLLQEAPRYEVLYYLYHELRHAQQYLNPKAFDSRIQESRFYVVLYNGTCFVLRGNQWIDCVLEGDEQWFTDAYLNLPYEVDANHFAYAAVKEVCGESQELENLHRFWKPKEQWDYDVLRNLFRRIEEIVIE